MGQKLGAKVVCGILPTDATYSWTIAGGAPYKNYSANNQTAVFTPLVLASETTDTLAFYCSKKAAELDVTCNVSSASLGLSVAVNLKGEIKEPVAEGEYGMAVGTMQNTAWQAQPAPGKWISADVNPERFAIFGNPIPGNQIVWPNGVPASRTPVEMGAYLRTAWNQVPYGPYAERGEWHFTQTVKDVISIAKDNAPTEVQSSTTGVPPSLTFVLDNTFIYPTSVGTFNTTPCPAHGALKRMFSDVPSVQILPFVQSISKDADYRLYVMYKPPGADSTYVPLKQRDWTAKGTTTRTNTSPLTFVDVDGGSATGSVTVNPPFPEWTTSWQVINP